MKNLPFLFLLFLIPSCIGDLLRGITDNQYASMPPLKHWDPFTPCMRKQGGVYCSSMADVVSDEPSELLQIMKNYTESGSRHYNYTKIDHAYCITKRCLEFYKGNSTSELRETMEACLNKTLTEEYGLKARLTKLDCYHHGEKKYSMDSLDIFFAVVVFGIVCVNIAGTLYDCLATNKDKNSLWMCCSLRANWNNLKAPWPSDAKAEQLKGINGLRVITSILVIAAHAFIPQYTSIENPQAMELVLDKFGTFLHLNMVMQTFFFLSGLFLAYSMQMSKTKKGGKSLIRAIFLRWLRLTPVCVMMVFITMTWLRFTPVSPGWAQIIGEEAEHCRRGWWYFVFSFNNYLDKSMCSLQSWSNACDFQMHIIGLTIIIMSPSKSVRNKVLWVLFLIAVAMPGIETYFRDLTGSMCMDAELSRNIMNFATDPTFTHVYKRTHTNLPCFVMGMALGFLIYDWQHNSDLEAKANKYRKYRFLYWLLYPSLWAVMGLSGLITMREGSRAPMSIRLFLAVVMKPLWGICIGLIILGLILKIEKVPIYRGILTSNFWVPLMKLSFCAYNVQMALIRWMQGQNTSLSLISDLQINTSYWGTITATFIASLIMWLLVEAPISNFIRKVFPEKKSTIDILKESEKKD